MKKYTHFSIIVILFFTLYITKANAAEVFISAPNNVTVDQNFEVFINADSDGKLINSIDITIDYDQELLSFSGYKNEGAVVGIWVQTPSPKNGNIYMSGIIPGGVSGLYDPNKKGLGAVSLARLIFTAKKEGKANFSFIKTEILEHDGSGTKLAHTETGKEVLIKNKADAGDDLNKDMNILDTEKPEPFEITFVEASIFSRTPPLIIFKANDVGSGIKEYKINEGDFLWKDAQSPQAVSRWILSRNISIRAYDFAGNFEESSIRIPGLMPIKYLIIIIILLAMSCIGGYKMLKHKHEAHP